jgi:protein-serine/threonine kinase
METWARSGVVEAKYLRFLRTKESLGNYIPIKTIGKGAFGEVRLVRKKQDGKVYALKRLVKTEMGMFKQTNCPGPRIAMITPRWKANPEYLVSRDQLPRVRAERDVLAESDSDWVVKLYTTFQDHLSLYMVMEFLPGGDLMTMLIRHQIFSEDITRFYMAELIMAIEAIHGMGFVHRDIKPDNILLDRTGHIKLADFGLATGFRRRHDSSYYQELLSRPPNNASTSGRPQRFSVNIDEISLTVSNRAQINEWRRSRRLLAFSAVGTPDYIAPEIISRQAYSFDVDWWSLGTIM